jgi:hypothetical protein
MLKRMAMVVVCVAMMVGTAQAGVLFDQDFDGATTLADVMDTSAPIDDHKFDQTQSVTPVITTEALGDNAMQLVRTGGGTSSIRRGTAIALATNLERLEFDFTLNTSGGTRERMRLELGTGLGFNISSTKRFLDLRFSWTAGDPVDQFRISNPEGAGGTTAALSGTQEIVIIANNSGSAQTYLGPAGATLSVADQKFDLWGNDVLLLDDSDSESVYGYSTISSILLKTPGYNPYTITIDNVLLTTDLDFAFEPPPVAEPGSAALVLLGAVGLMRKRRYV